MDGPRAVSLPFGHGGAVPVAAPYSARGPRGHRVVRSRATVATVATVATGHEEVSDRPRGCPVHRMPEVAQMGA